MKKKNDFMMHFYNLSSNVKGDNLDDSYRELTLCKNFPGVPPPRILRPPSGPPGVLPPGLPPPPGVGPNPNVLSAPPSIMKPPRKSGEEEKKNMATIEAKPQIKNLMGDVTRFMPTALKVKREGKDAKGRIKFHSKSFLFAWILFYT